MAVMAVLVAQAQPEQRVAVVLALPVAMAALVAKVALFLAMAATAA
jgi:hypothetical protein